MRQKVFIFLIIGWASYLSCQGCATPPELNRLVKSAIRRPFTLPSGLVAWRVESGVEITNKQAWILNPVIWEQALSDDVSVIWSPFPLDFKFQIFKSDYEVLGAQLSIFGPIRSRSRDLVWRPAVSFYQKRILNERLAIETEVLIEPESKTSHSANLPLTLGAWGGPLFALTENLAVSPRILIFYEINNPGARYLGDRPPDSTSPARFIYPLELFSSWQFEERWELQTDYIWSKLGFNDGYQNHQIFLSLLYFW